MGMSVYDTNNNKISAVYGYDSDLDYILDHEDKYTYTYDTHGNQTSYAIDNFNNGTIDSILTESYEYNSDGNIISVSSMRVSDNGGTVESQSTMTYVYDTDGNLVSTINNNDLTNSTTTMSQDNFQCFSK